MTPDEIEALSPFVFRERYSDWTGRAWLQIDGFSPKRVRIDARYGTLRKILRARFPDRPWQSDWQEGVFPVAPFGQPVLPALLAASILWMVLLGAGYLGLGLPAAAAIALVGAWPLMRWLDGVEVTPRGLRVGPPWAMRVPWHHVQRVGVYTVGRETRLWMYHRRGASSGSLPAVLLPALRAAISRHGALDLEQTDGGLDVRYASWQAAASGIPWGVLAGAAAGALLFDDLFGVLLVGGLVALGLAMLGAAVEARATGWGTGAVGWLTLLLGLIFAILAL